MTVIWRPSCLYRLLHAFHATYVVDGEVRFLLSPAELAIHAIIAALLYFTVTHAVFHSVTIAVIVAVLTSFLLRFVWKADLPWWLGVAAIAGLVAARINMR